MPVNAVLVHQRLQLVLKLHFALEAGVGLQLLQQGHLLLQLTPGTTKFGQLRNVELGQI